MAQIQSPISVSPKRQQLFQELDNLEVLRKENPAPDEPTDEYRIPADLLEPVIASLNILEDSFVSHWSVIEKQALESIRCKAATSHPERIVNDLHIAVMGLLDRKLYRGVPIDQIVDLLQLLLSVTRLMDSVLGVHRYHLDAEEFPWMYALYGQAIPADTAVELGWFAEDNRDWVMPPEMRQILQRATRSNSWLSARDYLRNQLYYTARPAHAVRVLFALWTIETELLHKSTSTGVTSAPN